MDTRKDIKKIVISIYIIVFIIGVVVIFNYTPYPPVKRMEYITGIPLKKELKPYKHDNAYSFNGNGYEIHSYHLTPSYLRQNSEYLKTIGFVEKDHEVFVLGKKYYRYLNPDSKSVRVLYKSVANDLVTEHVYINMDDYIIVYIYTYN